jgi:uridine kinase
MADRGQVLELVWSLVPDPGRPVLVAVDGGDGAGKTTFADALADEAPDGRIVVRASIDDFLRPRSRRHALGRTGQTVWEQTTDLTALRRELLDPWLAGPGTPYRRRWFDGRADAPVRDDPEPVPAYGVLVVDGVFAQRPELVDAWDLVVWLEVPDLERVRRMAARDGVSADADHPDQRRYLDAQGLYLERCRPRQSAGVVVDNTRPRHPVVVRSVRR